MVIGFLATEGFVHSQQLLWRHEGVVNGYQVGRRCCDIGDVDRDGWHDVITFTNEPANRLDGRILILSGRDGRSRLMDHVYNEVALGFRYPIAVGPAGDWNVDGFPDWWWTLYPWPMRVEVRCGRSNQVLFKAVQEGRIGSFGFSVIGDIDTDGDRRPDIVIADPKHYAYPGGRVHVFDNRGIRRYTISPPAGSDLTYTRHLAKLGDIDGDACEDFVMACPEPTGRGAAVVISGRTGAVLHIGYGELPGDSMHMKVSSAGDIDRDGVTDFAGTGAVFGAARGTVRAFSGRTGAALLTVARPAEPDMGWELGGGFDIDLDGVPDLVVISTNFSIPYLHSRIYVFSGRDGRELYQMRGDFSGNFLTLLPAAPGNPFPLMVTSWTGSGVVPVGRIDCYRMMPLGATYLGDGCSTSTSLLLGMSPQPPTVLRGRVTLSGPPGAACALLFAPPASPIDLTQFGYPGCWLRSTNPSIVLSLVLAVAGPDRGLAAVELPLPFVERSIRVFDLQGVALTTTGLALSAGIRAQLLR
jgi:hypothetical protein